MDTLDHLPQTGANGQTLERQLESNPTEHKQFIGENGQDMPEIRNWKWHFSALEAGHR